MSDELFFGNKLDYPYEFMGYMVYENYSECLTCGAQVVGGIIQKANHWKSCAGAGYVDALKEIFQEKGTIAEQDVDSLNEKFNLP